MSGGISTYTPCAPANARLKASVSSTPAANASAPRLTSGASLLLSRPIARTFLPLSNNFLATTDPVFPVAPKMTYMISSRSLHEFDAIQNRKGCVDLWSYQDNVQFYGIGTLIPVFLANE